MTRGIRQGCPLASLLFILAVGLIYDVIENDTTLAGIPLQSKSGYFELKIAGFADDTAIYLRNSSMQVEAIAAVQEFSDMTGLRLNIKKSVAIHIGDQIQGGAMKDDGTGISEVGDTIEPVESTRYLGHIAGVEDTTVLAWEKAFAALRIRLSLAEAKTNSVQQRAAIADAVIIPKLLYVARHTWPTDKTVKEADSAIRNFVWNSTFHVPERAVAGWVQASVAEQDTKQGGLGIPNFQAELLALSSMVVGQWALTTRRLTHIIGDILQWRDTGKVERLLTAAAKPKLHIAESLWTSGAQWAAKHFENNAQETEEGMEHFKQTRRFLRINCGAQTRWSAEGLVVRCSGRALKNLQERRTRRKKRWGQCMTGAVAELPVTYLQMGDNQGDRQTWRQYKSVLPTVTDVRVKDVVQIKTLSRGVGVFFPVTQEIPMDNTSAHWFRQLALNIVANFPELTFNAPEPRVMKVSHRLKDRHHVFEVSHGPGNNIVHSWASTETIVPWDAENEGPEIAVSKFLHVPTGSIWTSPHVQLTRMLPLWTGNRRWAQTRKRYKSLINKRRDEEAATATQIIRDKLSKGNEAVANALNKLKWKTVQRMELVTAYLTQNIVKLKLNSLRLWVNKEQGHRCQSDQCINSRGQGTLHLAWSCREAQLIWKAVAPAWGVMTHVDNGTNMDGLVPVFFRFRLRRIPHWTIRWGSTSSVDDWDELFRYCNEMWQSTCAVVLTCIWRRNVDRVHRKERRVTSIEEAQTDILNLVREAIRRYKSGLYPLTKRSLLGLQIADLLIERWATTKADLEGSGSTTITRIGFFDGGPGETQDQAGAGALSWIWTMELMELQEHWSGGNQRHWESEQLQTTWPNLSGYIAC